MLPGGRLRWEALRRAFWLPAAVGLVAGAALAWALRALDSLVDLGLGLFPFEDLSSARAVLSAIATVTVSVVALSFSVTLVALQLASSQLSPRVLTTFREDRIAQLTLAAFLAVFAYALVLLGRLTADDAQVPQLSLAIAMLGVLAAFGLFVAFVARFVAGLQASEIIRRIASDGHRAVSSAHPRGIGRPANDELAARAELERRRSTGTRVPLRAGSPGFLLELDAHRLLRAARRHDALVVQRAHIGDLLVSGQLVADAHLAGDPAAGAVEDLEAAFRYGTERTMAADVAFPLRALADVALRALSPALNDPTTAENALGALVDTLVRFVLSPRPQALRVDRDGAPRLLAHAPDLDDLVALGFEQVRLMVVDEHPVLAARLVTWLRELDRIAEAACAPRGQLARQLELLEPTAARARLG